MCRHAVAGRHSPNATRIYINLYMNTENDRQLENSSNCHTITGGGWVVLMVIVCSTFRLYFY